MRRARRRTSAATCAPLRSWPQCALQARLGGAGSVGHGPLQCAEPGHPRWPPPRLGLPPCAPAHPPASNQPPTHRSCFFKIYLGEGLARLALLGASHTVLTLALAAAARSAALRPLYTEHREAIVSLSALHCTLVTRHIAVRCWLLRCAVAGWAVHCERLGGSAAAAAAGRSARARPAQPQQRCGRGICPPARPQVNGGTNVFLHHGGSPLRLLGLLLACSHCIWRCEPWAGRAARALACGPEGLELHCAAGSTLPAGGALSWRRPEHQVHPFCPLPPLRSSTYFLQAGLPWRWSRVALPLAVLLPLATERSICHRMVATPGAPGPLADLHALLHLAHWPALVPATHGLALAAAGDPLQQCITVELWTLLWLGIALPLAALKALERRGRRLFERQQLQAAGGASASGDAGAAGADGAWRRPRPASAARRRELRLTLPFSSPRWRAYLSSCWSFGLACAAAAAWCERSAAAPA